MRASRPDELIARVALPMRPSHAPRSAVEMDKGVFVKKEALVVMPPLDPEVPPPLAHGNYARARWECMHARIGRGPCKHGRGQHPQEQGIVAVSLGAAA